MKNDDRVKSWIHFGDLFSSFIFVLFLILIIMSVRFFKERSMVKKHVQENTIQAEILITLQKKLQHVGVPSTVEGDVLHISNETFGFSSAQATPEHLKIVSHLASALVEVLPCFSKQNPWSQELQKASWCSSSRKKQVYCPIAQRTHIESIMIEGHTDATPMNDGATGFVDNWALSSERALTLLRMMMSCEASLGSFVNSKGQGLFGASVYSSNRPAFDNPFDPRNRRIDIRIMTK